MAEHSFVVFGKMETEKVFLNLPAVQIIAFLGIPLLKLFNLFGFISESIFFFSIYLAGRSNLKLL